MNRYIIGSLWDRDNRNGANKNFEYLFEGSKRVDALNSRADNVLSKSNATLNEAQKTNDMNKDVQEQVNKFISEFESTGETNLEIVQARGDYDVLNERISDLTTTQEYKSEKHTPKSIALSSFGDDRRPFITFTDDDGFKEYYDYIAPTLEEYGFVGCPAIITSTIDTSGRMTKDNLLELQDRGHEILSHTQDHLFFHQISVEEIDRQCRLSKETLIDWGLKVDTIIYPGGNTGGPEGRERVKKYYRSGWSSSSALANERYRKLENAYIPFRISVDNGTITELKKIVDLAIEENSWVVFMTHANIQTPERKKTFKDLVEYVASKNIDVGTMAEGLDIFGHSFDIGSDAKKYLRIDAEGDMVSNGIGSVFRSRHEGYDIDLNTHLSFFEPEKITYSRFLNADNIPFPESHIGTLETFCSRISPNNSYQIWRPYTSTNIYRRSWVGTIVVGEWQGWTTHGLQLDNSIKMNTLKKDIPSDLVITNAPSTAGFPTAGTVVTLNSDANVYTKQLFFPAYSNELYYRGFNLDGTGMEFQRIPKQRKTSFGIDTLTFEVGQNVKTVDVDLTDFLGVAINTNSIPYTLTTRSEQMSKVVFSSNIRRGILTITFIDPNEDSTTSVYMPNFNISIFE